MSEYGKAWVLRLAGKHRIGHRQREVFEMQRKQGLRPKSEAAFIHENRRFTELLRRGRQPQQIASETVAAAFFELGATARQAFWDGGGGQMPRHYPAFLDRLVQ